MIEPSELDDTTGQDDVEHMTYADEPTALELAFIYYLRTSGLELSEVKRMVDNASQYGLPKQNDNNSMYLPHELDFIASFIAMSEDIHQTAVANGWHGYGGNNIRDKVDMLMHASSEQGEVYRAWHKGDPESDKLNGYLESEEELADAQIMQMSMARAHGMRLAFAIVDKARYNKTREYKHGKHFSS
jgi:NTP pyrophosphatase (non-canonical NTP hydrolase)